MRRLKVVCLYVIEEKGKPGIRTESVRINKGGGISGDRHCLDGDDSLSISTGGIDVWMENEKVKGLCFRRFKANILLEAVGGAGLAPGARLKGPHAAIEITREKGPCYGNCERRIAGLPCRLSGECWFAKGTVEGELHTGDYLDLCD